MSEDGFSVHLGTDGTRVEIECAHQSGILYAVPGEASWVCSAELLHAHGLAGFLRELVALEDPRVRWLMQRWGLYPPRAPGGRAGERAPGGVARRNVDRPTVGVGDDGARRRCLVCAPGRAPGVGVAHHHPVQVGAARVRAPFPADQRGELAGLVVAVGGLGEALPGVRRLPPGG